MSSEKEPEFKKCLENVVERLNAKKEHKAIVKECREALDHIGKACDGIFANPDLAPNPTANFNMQGDLVDAYNSVLEAYKTLRRWGAEERR